MNSPDMNFIVRLQLWLGLILLPAGLLPAQTAPETTDIPATEEVAELPTTAEPELRRLDVAEAAAAVEVEVTVATEAPSAAAADASGDVESVDTGAEASVAAETSAATEGDVEVLEHRSIVVRHHGNNVPLGNHHVPADAKVREMVSLLGDSVLDGESDGGVVSIMGNTTVNGKAGGEAVAVMGNVTVNGEVGREVVAVMGNVILGPNAVVRGDVVSVGGKLQLDPTAVVEGDVQEINFFGAGMNFDWLKLWLKECALLGRPLAFHAGLGWAWMLAGVVFALYVLLALLFPRAFDKCTETLENRPGYSLLAVLLTVLFTPVLIILLVATGVGIILLPFVVAALMFASFFGKAVMHAWLGRRITKYFGPGPMAHAATATLIGGVLLLLLYTVPILGMLLAKVFSVVGTGVVVYTLFLGMRREPAASPPIAAGATAAGAVVAAGMPSAAEAPTAATVQPVLSPVALVNLPRAGFWIRIAASLIDIIIVGLVIMLTVPDMDSYFILILMLYSVVLWALKGTTIGGIICGLKVIRLDDRPVDWTVAIVRGLGGFLSLVVVGLGYIWVAFDREQQSWHDKIAGTVIVRVPKGTPLI
ncbi:MAG: RDD family protein [Opitutaceae bacterium]|nr:RDD family protein [Opitutaceae bacterium]